MLNETTEANQNFSLKNRKKKANMPGIHFPNKK